MHTHIHVHTYYLLVSLSKKIFFAVSELHLKSSSAYSVRCVCVCGGFLLLLVLSMLSISSVWFLFCCWVVFFYMGISQFVYPFPCWWIYMLFPIFDSFIFIILIWTFLYKSFVDIDFCFFWMAVVGLKIDLLNIVRNSKTVRVVIQSWAILYYHQQSEGFQCSIPYQHLYRQSLNFSHSHGYILVSLCVWLCLWGGCGYECWALCHFLPPALLPWHTELVLFMGY